MAVGFDHVAASQVLVDHLISKGYRRFGYIGWINNDFSAEMGQALPQPLTTIRTFRYDIGRIAARNVLKSLTNTPVSKITDVGFELVEGATV